MLSRRAAQNVCWLLPPAVWLVSFLRGDSNGKLQQIDRISNDPMIVNEAAFEAPSKFKTPCVFFTGLIEHDGDLLCSYGAADEHVGLMRIDYPMLLGILSEQ